MEEANGEDAEAYNHRSVTNTKLNVSRVHTARNPKFFESSRCLLDKIRLLIVYIVYSSLYDLENPSNGQFSHSFLCGLLLLEPHLNHYWTLWRIETIILITVIAY